MGTFSCVSNTPIFQKLIRWAINIFLILGSFASTVLVLEGLLVFAVPPPIQWEDPQELYHPDTILGHRLAPRQHSFTHSFPVTTNSYGFRDREVSIEPSPDILRILCLGDSLTFGDGVAMDATYPKQVEALLNAAKPTLRYEVINAGVPSYDTWQEIAFFAHKGIEFKPDIVLLGFYGNDVVPRPSSVQAFLTKGGTLRRQGLGEKIPDRFVHALKRSRLLLLLKDRLGKVSNLVSPSDVYLHQQAILNDTPNEFVKRGWLEVEASIKQMVELQKVHRFRFIVVIFPMPDQMLDSYPNAQYPRVLKEILAKHQIESIDLQPRFTEQFRDFGSLFIEWDGHPNPKAYRIAAEEIARVISR